MVSREQLAFFARNGFLQVSELISSETCDALIDLTWERLPPTWSRHDPASWVGPVTDSCHTHDVRFRRGHIKFQRGNVNSPAVTNAFGVDGVGGRLGHALIGHRLSQTRYRGLYLIAPVPDDDIDPYSKPHIEAHPCQLIALCYLDDVSQAGGGLFVWPGSHREIYPVMESKLDHVAGDRYEDIYNRWAALTPMALAGCKGDIVIIHHRLLHAPSVNRTNKIRFGFLCDYQRKDFQDLCKQLPGEDMWADWPAIAALQDAMKNAPSDFELTPMESPRGISALVGRGEPTSTRKTIASMLARVRRPGEYWLTISDDERILSNVSLDPCGSDLRAAGVEVLFNGKPLVSRSQFDVIERVDLQTGANEIKVSGERRKLWLRLIRIELPFTSSPILHGQELSRGRAAVTLNFDPLGSPPVTCPAPSPNVNWLTEAVLG